MSLYGSDIPEDLIQDEIDSTGSEDSAQSEKSNAPIYKEYGGFNRFLITYGLSISNHDDVEEGKAIATEMRRADEQNAREAKRQQRTPQQRTPQQRTPQQHSQRRSQQNRPPRKAKKSSLVRNEPIPMDAVREESVPMAVREEFVPMAVREEFVPMAVREEFIPVAVREGFVPMAVREEFTGARPGIHSSERRNPVTCSTCGSTYSSPGNILPRS